VGSEEKKQKGKRNFRCVWGGAHPQIWHERKERRELRTRKEGGAGKCSEYFPTPLGGEGWPQKKEEGHLPQNGNRFTHVHLFINRGAKGRKGKGKRPRARWAAARKKGGTHHIVAALKFFPKEEGKKKKRWETAMSAREKGSITTEGLH